MVSRSSPSPLAIPAPEQQEMFSAIDGVQDDFPPLLAPADFLLLSGKVLMYTLRSAPASVMTTSCMISDCYTKKPQNAEHTLETSLPEVFLILGDQASASDTPDVSGRTLLHLLGHGVLSEDVRDGNAATRFQEAEHLVKYKLLLALRDEVDDAVGDDGVGDAILEWDAGDGRFDELGDLISALFLVFLGQGQHILEEELVAGPMLPSPTTYLVHVHANSPASRADLSGREEYVEAATGSEVNYCLTLWDLLGTTVFIHQATPWAIPLADSRPPGGFRS